MTEDEAQTAHEQLVRLLAYPEHDSDCATEEATGSAVGIVCTCTSGRLSNAMSAVLHAHRPRPFTDDEREYRVENEIDTPVECAGDGVLCVDSHENSELYPCPTIQIIARAVGAT